MFTLDLIDKANAAQRNFHLTFQTKAAAARVTGKSGAER